jgi:PAS domain S-box-containing protein
MEKSEHSKQTGLLAGDSKLFRVAWRMAPDPMVLFDLEGRVLEVNQAFGDLVGLSREEVEERDISLILAGDFGEEARARFREQFDRAGVAPAYETRITRADGDERLLEVHFTFLEQNYMENGQERNSGNPRIAMLATVHDITERKEGQRKLEQQAARQAELLRQLTTAQDAERRRLAMDLHDGPLQSLAVTLMALDRAKMRADRGEYDVAERERHFARETLTEIVHEMRATLADISSELLAERGFSVALVHHADVISEASGIAVRVTDQMGARLPLEIEMLLYRLMQEAVSNARKYSEASEIVITARKVTAHGSVALHLSVEDNGRGFDIEEGLKKRDDGSGLGLGSMRQRIEAIGGEMKITSHPGKGTIVRFSCPIPEAI